MTYTRRMTSHFALAETCARHEDDAGRHLLVRTHPDFSEEMIRWPDSTATCPFFLDRNGAAQDAADVQARPALRMHASLGMAGSMSRYNHAES